VSAATDTPIGDSVERDLPRLMRGPAWWQLRARHAQRIAAERAAAGAHERLMRSSEVDALWEQRFALLGDGPRAYCERYGIDPPRWDTPGFVDDELARLDAEIAERAHEPA
jgi:hypothetical protein